MLTRQPLRADTPRHVPFPPCAADPPSRLSTNGNPGAPKGRGELRDQPWSAYREGSRRPNPTE
ncbi:hypothetical protein GCM10010236_02860 [Streptomyces eurythermus]|nr:hypothetical protein GCM10010236_02860 [Streptomyces eurythermus]